MLSYIGERPTLPELLRLDLYHSIGTKYKIFGIFLLNDETGTYVDTIENENFGNIELIVMKILQSWLMGNGRAVKWGILVQTLKQCEIHHLAHQIEDRIKGMYGIYNCIHMYILYVCTDAELAL